jgi:ribosomal-protein-alanine N-acetyltransferase
MTPLPILDTDRLRIRPLTWSDVDDYNRVVHSDPDVMRYLRGGQAMPRNYTRNMIDYFIDHAHTYGFTFMAVTDKTSGAFMGHCGLHQLSDVVEVGYALGKAYWGAGYATEAARAVMRWGFETLSLEEMIAVAYPENLASRRVMERLGMIYEGEFERYYSARLSLYRILKTAFMSEAKRHKTS